MVNFHQLTNQLVNQDNPERYNIRVQTHAHGCLKHSFPSRQTLSGSRVGLLTFSALEGLRMYDQKWTSVQEVVRPREEYRDMYFTFSRLGRCDKGVRTSMVVYVGGEKSQRLPLQRYVLDVFARKKVRGYNAGNNPDKEVLLSDLLDHINTNLLPLLRQEMSEKHFDILVNGPSRIHVL